MSFQKSVITFFFENMAKLFFPPLIKIADVTSFKIPSFTVDIAVTKTGDETRSKINDIGHSGSMSLVLDEESCETLDSLIEFYTLAHGSWQSFEIRDSHPLWDLLPPSAKETFLPFWRFDSELDFSSVDASLLIYGCSFSLKNVSN